MNLVAKNISIFVYFIHLDFSEILVHKADSASDYLKI